MVINLTESAAAEMKRILAEREQTPDESYVRMVIAGGGCSGLEHGMSLETEFDPKVDAQYEKHGVTMIADKKMALYLTGMTIDVIETPQGNRFSITNPNVPRTGCAGCGG